MTIKSLYANSAYPRNLLCLLLSGVSNQVMMAPNFTLFVASLRMRGKASNGNYHSSPPLTAQLPEFKGISLIFKKEKQN